MDMDTFINREIAIIYAYRYLLDREPESFQLVTCNERSWQKLRIDIMNSLEYKRVHGGGGGGAVNSWQKPLADQISTTGAPPDYEQILEQSYTKLINTGDTVIDIGAHIGRHSKVFCKLIGLSETLLAFEPLPEQFGILERELSASNVTIINKALSDQTGTMCFYQVENYPEESGLKKRKYNAKDAITRQIQVGVDTLDHYIDKISNINYIKLDAEGAELSILKGAVECLERFRPIISIEYGEPSYSAYGLTADSLYAFASEQKYYITDLCGNVVLDINMWREICDSVYWDYFLVPQEKIKDFWLKIHS